MLRYNRDNKTLGLKYYADLNDAPVTNILRQANIKTNNRLMEFSDSSWKDCPDTGRSKGAYIIYYQGVPIDHGTHVKLHFEGLVHLLRYIRYNKKLDYPLKRDRKSVV